ncbi:ScbR family autoregulator-binding transcription factor [Streptomyces violascens]|uniref:ScbR family autoregulator-binding transcription factor n=1 Tax=Streptomyces violascens TaxID=67381 RepID=UPI0036558E41
MRTRARILDVAAKLFADKGFPAVTILDVAQLSDITKGAVYFHYANKEALAVAVADEFYRRIHVLAQSVGESDLSPLASVAELLVRTAMALRDDIVMQAGARLQIERAMIETELPIPFQGYTRLITTWLAKGAEDGTLDRNTDPDALAFVLVSAFFGAQHISWVLNNRADITTRTLTIIRTVIPSAYSSLLLCPSVQRAIQLEPGGSIHPRPSTPGDIAPVAADDQVAGLKQDLNGCRSTGWAASRGWSGRRTVL